MAYRSNYRDSQASDSVKLSNFNQAGLEEAEQNYFLKYANSAHSQVNNTQRLQKRTESQVHQVNNRTSNQYVQQTNIYPSGFSKIKSNQSQVLRQLKQQYQILRNLPIDDRGEFQKKRANQYKDSQLSSSIRDERSEDTSSRRSENHKKTGRDAQILSLQKKQLEIVISNSMKKIEELLTNQMDLKKTIHQLKLQIDGKGGINSQYENMIRNYKKNQSELKQTIQKLKIQTQRKNLAIKQASERIAFLQGEKSRRDSESRGYFDEQRKLDDLLRKQKDKTMNMEIQNKKIQMQFEIFQKDKTSEINRLMKQLQFNSNSSSNEKESQTIKRLNEQIRVRQSRYQMVLDQLQQAKKNATNAPQTDNKQVLQNLIRQIKGESSNSSELFLKAILSKIQNKKPDQGLRSQLSNLRMQFDTLRRNSMDQSGMLSANQPELKIRIKQLQRTIQDQKRQKRMLNDQIQKLRSDKAQIQNQAQHHRRKVRQLKQTQDRLIRQIEEIGHIKIQLHQSKTQNLEMKSKIQGILSGNIDLPNKRPNNLSHQQENRSLKRRIDQLQFSVQKADQQRSFSQGILVNTHKKELQNIISDLQRTKSLLNQKQQELTRTIQQYKSQVQAKNLQIQALKKGLFESNDKARGEFDRIKVQHQDILKAAVAKHYSQIQILNQKVLQITKSNQILMMHNQKYLTLQKESVELRSIVRKYKHVSQSVDHLWQVKEAEYQNISQILVGTRR